MHGYKKVDLYVLTLKGIYTILRIFQKKENCRIISIVFFYFVLNIFVCVCVDQMLTTTKVAKTMTFINYILFTHQTNKIIV